MTARYKIQKGGTYTGDGDLSHTGILTALAQTECRRVTSGVTALDNNSGGTEGSSISQSATLVNADNDGGDLAGKSTTEDALNTVLDALSELITKGNETVIALGEGISLTDNSGATASNGTVDAITVSVTGAATGVQADDVNAVITDLDNMQYHSLLQINALRRAVGLDEVTADYSLDYVATIASITVDGGTAADPGVKKSAMDSVLENYRDNIKTLAEKLIDVNTAGKPLVVAV